jgi:cell division topological specificity factor MinE
MAGAAHLQACRWHAQVSAPDASFSAPSCLSCQPRLAHASAALSAPDRLTSLRISRHGSDAPLRTCPQAPPGRGLHARVGKRAVRSSAAVVAAANSRRGSVSDDAKALRGADPSNLGFADKVAYAWRLFFPQQVEDHARADAKKRLRMILVADRCALSSQSLAEMKRKIVEVVSEFVVVDQGEPVDVSMTADEEQGTIFSVAIPVKRVKSEAFEGNAAELELLNNE